MAGRQRQDGLGRPDPLRHHLHLGDDFLESLPPAQGDPDAPVSALIGEARDHEVSHPGEAGERERGPAEGHAEPGELGQRPGDQSRLGIVSVAEPVGHAGGYRHGVLERPGRLATHHVRVGVHPEGGTHERVLEHRGDIGIGRGHHRSCRLAECNLPGQVGPGEDPDTRRIGREHLGGHLGHPQLGPALDALAQADDHRLG